MELAISSKDNNIDFKKLCRSSKTSNYRFIICTKLHNKRHEKKNIVKVVNIIAKYARRWFVTRYIRRVKATTTIAKYVRRWFAKRFIKTVKLYYSKYPLLLWNDMISQPDITNIKTYYSLDMTNKYAIRIVPSCIISRNNNVSRHLKRKAKKEYDIYIIRVTPAVIIIQKYMRGFLTRAFGLSHKYPQDHALRYSKTTCPRDIMIHNGLYLPADNFDKSLGLDRYQFQKLELEHLIHRKTFISIMYYRYKLSETIIASDPNPGKTTFRMMMRVYKPEEYDKTVSFLGITDEDCIVPDHPSYNNEYLDDSEDALFKCHAKASENSRKVESYIDVFKPYECRTMRLVCRKWYTGLAGLPISCHSCRTSLDCYNFNIYNFNIDKIVRMPPFWTSCCDGVKHGCGGDDGCISHCSREEGIDMCLECVELFRSKRRLLLVYIIEKSSYTKKISNDIIILIGNIV